MYRDFDLGLGLLQSSGLMLVLRRFGCSLLWKGVYVVFAGYEMVVIGGAGCGDFS